MEPGHRQLSLADVKHACSSCRNLISIEHAALIEHVASAVLDVFCLVFRFCIELETIVYGSIRINYFIQCILQICNTKSYSFQNLILGFVKIRKFQPRYSYKIYCKMGDSAAPISLQLILVKIQINKMRDNLYRELCF